MIDLLRKEVCADPTHQILAGSPAGLGGCREQGEFAPGEPGVARIPITLKRYKREEMMSKVIGRRQFLRLSAMAAAGAAAVACQPQTVVVKETVEVEKEVTSVVEKEVTTVVEKEVTKVVEKEKVVEVEAASEKQAPQTSRSVRRPASWPMASAAAWPRALRSRMVPRPLPSTCAPA
jgi:hypothetical protein